MKRVDLQDGKDELKMIQSIENFRQLIGWFGCVSLSREYSDSINTSWYRVLIPMCC